MNKKEKTHKYLCIHGHFYQPPRENPWIDFVQYQRSAEPYHDWNERITRECYGPNSRSRLHGKDGRIERLVNNYEYMSFNFGPTLLTWMEKNSPWIYQQILEADKISRKRYDGHGNAIAQVYNHMIMPLATKRDKITQIRWGMTDFRHRFDRDPEGMWLAETAVDMETLELLAREGIKFTILSPDQAKSIRPIMKVKDKYSFSKKTSDKDNSETWKDVSGGRIDTTRPYRVLFDETGDLSIDVFFYNGPLSRAIAYEKILSSGENLLKRIEDAYSGANDRPELINLATDGESYGHHFKFGEMALTWVFDSIDRDEIINLINYGHYLDLFPPEMEVRIFENSSWSCSHGIERWRSDCGCSVSRNPEWNQAWRTPLREGLDWLSAQLSDIYEKQTKAYLNDCWKARDDYINILIDPEGDEKEFQEYLIKSIGTSDKIKLYSLLESQRMAMFMFTSCGWFFDDISGLEVRQILMYASRAIELCNEWTDTDLERGLLKYLETALSNVPRYINGANIYKECVSPSRMTPSYITAHFAISRLEEGIPMEPWLQDMSFSVNEKRIKEGETQILVGKVRIREKQNGRERNHVYIAVRTNGRGLNCLVGVDNGNDIQKLEEDIRQCLSAGASEKCLDLFSLNFPGLISFKLEDLITDTKKWLIISLARKLGYRVKASIGFHNSIIDDFTELLKRSKIEIPLNLIGLFKILVTDSLSLVLGDDKDSLADFRTIREMIELFGTGSYSYSSVDKIPSEVIRDLFRQADIRQLIQSYMKFQIKSLNGPNRSIHLKNIKGLIDLINDIQIEIDLWEFQNLYYDINLNREHISTLESEDLALFQKIGNLVGFINEEK
jgi:alpha-amylase/alpha-mannosidase (GH57 family)